MGLSRKLCTGTTHATSPLRPSSPKSVSVNGRKTKEVVLRAQRRERDQSWSSECRGEANSGLQNGQGWYRDREKFRTIH